ncbi:MAG: nuclear transport factor 2 family protein [Chthonomonadales bacterium]
MDQSLNDTLLSLTHRMLVSIHEGDLETYSSMCVPQLTCFETDVAPFRIDGIDFHLDLMRSTRENNGFAGLVRFDLLTPSANVYGESAVVTYTRLMTYSIDKKPLFRAFNESRVFVRFDGEWKMVHFHRSQAAV